MKSWMTFEDGIVIYFHLTPPRDARELMLLAGRGDIHDVPTVGMPHRLFDYFLDTFRWIPTRFASMARVPFERAAIAADGALTARKIFAGWAQIFSSANDDVILTVGAGFPAGTLTVQRDDLVNCMSSLESFTHEVERGEKIIYLSDSLDYREKRGASSFSPPSVAPSGVIERYWNFARRTKSEIPMNRARFLSRHRRLEKKPHGISVKDSIYEHQLPPSAYAPPHLP